MWLKYSPALKFTIFVHILASLGSTSITYRSDTFGIFNLHRSEGLCYIFVYMGWTSVMITGGGVSLGLWGELSKRAYKTWSNSLITGIYPSASARRHCLMFPPYQNNVYMNYLRYNFIWHWFIDHSTSHNIMLPVLRYPWLYPSIGSITKCTSALIRAVVKYGLLWIS